MLKELFTEFDKICLKFNVYKLYTIGIFLKKKQFKNINKIIIYRYININKNRRLLCSFRNFK